MTKPTKVLKSKFQRAAEREAKAALKQPKGAWHKKNLEIEKTLEIIRANNSIVFIADLCLALDCSTECLRNYFPKDSEADVQIMAAISANRTAVKARLRKKWFEGNNPTTDIALYKLLATPEERAALDNSAKIEQRIESKDTIIQLRID